MKELRRKGRAPRPADGVGAAGQYDAGRVAAADLLLRRVVRDNLAVDGKLTDSAPDELCVLRTKIQDKDVFAVNGLAPDCFWL